MKMKDVDQTHPHTNRAFGFVVYERDIIADGGRAETDQQMRDVEHGTPSTAEGAHRTFERGSESPGRGSELPERAGTNVRGDDDE
jgi:hypothetical protein